MKKGLLPYITPLLALGLAGIAGLISILGMSKLFAGQAEIVMVVMAMIEAGKVVGASILHNEWKNKAYRAIKFPLLFMVLVAMTITSFGVYGFFTDAYQTTAGELSINQKEIELIENKKKVFRLTIENTETQIEFKNGQAQKLVDLRTQQEVRLDSLLANNHWTNAKRTQEQIEEANQDLKKIQADIDTMYMEVTALNDSIGKLDIQILETQSNSEASAELGPLIYIARVFDKDMDDVVNFVMYFIMFVFDPLAMILIIVTNKQWRREKVKTTHDGIVTIQPSNSPIGDLFHNEIQYPSVGYGWEGFNDSKLSGLDIEKDVEENYDPSLIEEDTLEDVFVTPKKEEKVETDTEGVDSDKVIETEPRMVSENFKEPERTKGDDITDRWRDILKNRKKQNRGNNNITRLGEE